MNQKLKLHNIDINDFIKTVDTCKGGVFLETEEGDCLNLKSKLCQLTGLTKLIEGGIIVEATVRCENPEDESKLFRFNLYQEVPEKN
mgnify:FL=1